MSKQHSILLPKTATTSNEFIVKYRPFDKVEANWTCSICFDFVKRTKFHSTLFRNRQHCCWNRQYCCPKRQQCRSNIRLRCFDIVASVDGALRVWSALIAMTSQDNRECPPYTRHRPTQTDQPCKSVTKWQVIALNNEQICKTICRCRHFKDF